MLADVIARIKDKIVIIKNPDGSTGSGIVLDNRGIIVTNCHVISGCRTVGIETSAGNAFLGKVIAADKKIDFAFVLCESLRFVDYPTLSRREPVLEGEDVVAIGHPLGYGFTVSKGIVSSSRREINGVWYIQTDAPINPGNSGGPLIDTNGEILGIVTWIVSNANSLSFVVPVKYIVSTYENLPPVEQLRAGYYCPSCCRLNAEKKQFCSLCGVETKKEPVVPALYENTGICHSCGKQNPAESKYCQGCGVVLYKKQVQQKQTDNSIAAGGQAVTCTSCGQENSGKKYCSRCGTTLELPAT